MRAVGLPLVDSYHSPLHALLHVPPHNYHLKFPSGTHDLGLNSKRANFPELYGELSCVDWSGVESCPGVEEACGVFYSIINDVISRHVPRSRSGGFSYPAWFTPAIVAVTVAGLRP